jgi:Xaa-Pro aminopeptidase
MTTKQRLARLRNEMRERGLSAYFVPSSDPHQSEYVPTCWKRRSWLSGFHGSAGDVLVTLDDAGLWTDGRYFLQAESDLAGTGIRLFRAGEAGVPSIEQFLSNHLKLGDTLGIDPQVVSHDRAASLHAASERAGAQMARVEPNLVDLVWADRPALARNPVTRWPTKFAGETVRSKLSRVRKAMHDAGATAHVITTLDAIAWLLNIRGSDVDYNPVTIAYVIVTQTDATLFVDAKKLSGPVRKVLETNVQIRPYSGMGSACARLRKRGAKVWVDPASANAWCIEALGTSVQVVAPSPIGRMKAAKNSVELAGMRAAHLRDGVAMVRFLHWLEKTVAGEGTTELGAATQLEQFRAQGEHFRGLSFPTIAGYGPHGAIIHYSVDESTDIALRPAGLFLLDSGAQYTDGTTDITRTILLGERGSAVECDRFTRVLKGHIALACAVFPAGSSGARLDTLARMSLWQAGLDYAHGTGHGVGAFLNVHEGPQSISHSRGLGAPLEVGNVQSNEPGFYEPGKFGIRIENLIEVVRDEAVSKTGSEFHSFETLTLCPIERRLIIRDMMTDGEIKWLNRYHARVRRELSPLLDNTQRRWLARACTRI